MLSLSRIWRLSVRGLEVFTIALFAGLVGTVLWGVISRYIPGIRPSAWTEELAIYLLIWISLLGAALTYRGYGHLGVDYFVLKLDPQVRHLVQLLVEVAALIFAGTVLIYGGFRLVLDTLQAGQLTPVLQWRIGYLYAAVPLSGAFFCAFSIEHLFDLRRGAPGAGSST